MNPIKIAIEQAKIATNLGEVPVGAVIIDCDSKKIIAKAHNLTETNNDPTAHAEIIAIRGACRILAAPRLINCDIFVTLEPCPMCAAAISFARFRRLYFGAYDHKSGGVENGAIYNQPTCHHKPEIIGGIEEVACGDLLKEFFVGKR